MGKLAILRQLVKAKNLMNSAGKGIKTGWNATKNGAKKIPTIFKGKPKPQASLEGVTRQNFGKPTRTYEVVNADGTKHEIELFEETSRRFGFFGKKYTTQTRFRKGEDAPISQVVKYTKGKKAYSESINSGKNITAKSVVNKKTGDIEAQTFDASGQLRWDRKGNIKSKDGLKISNDVGSLTYKQEKVKFNNNKDSRGLGISKIDRNNGEFDVIETIKTDGQITSNKVRSGRITIDQNGQRTWSFGRNPGRDIDPAKINAFEGNLTHATNTVKGGFDAKKVTKYGALTLAGAGAVWAASEYGPELYNSIIGDENTDENKAAIEDSKNTDAKNANKNAADANNSEQTKTPDEIINDITTELNNKQAGDTVIVSGLPDGQKITLEDDIEIENGDKVSKDEEGNITITKGGDQPQKEIVDNDSTKVDAPKKDVENKNDENVENKNDENVENKNDENVENKNDENVENKKDENVENKNDENVENKNDENVENKKDENIENKNDENVKNKKDENVENKNDENVENKKEPVKEINETGKKLFDGKINGISNETHTVKTGECLWNIARAALEDANPGVKITNGQVLAQVKEFIKLNPQIKNPDLIYPNQEIKMC